MGYNSIRIIADTAGSSVNDFRMQGKIITSILVGDVPKTTDYEQPEGHSEILNFTDGTTVDVGDYVTVNFEV